MTHRYKKSARSSKGRSQKFDTRLPKGTPKPRVPKHYKTAHLIDRVVDEFLHDNESVVDIAFRAWQTKLGPEGWGVIIQIQFMGQTKTAGIVIPPMIKPSAKVIREGLDGLRKVLDSATFESQLKPKPGELAKLQGASPVSPLKP